MNDLFTCGSTALDPLQDEDDSDCDDSTVDQIDEQEIYGWFCVFCFFLVPSPVGHALLSFVKRKERKEKKRKRAPSTFVDMSFVLHQPLSSYVPSDGYYI